MARPIDRYFLDYKASTSSPWQSAFGAPKTQSLVTALCEKMLSKGDAVLTRVRRAHDNRIVYQAPGEFISGKHRASQPLDVPSTPFTRYDYGAYRVVGPEYFERGF